MSIIQLVYKIPSYFIVSQAFIKINEWREIRILYVGVYINQLLHRIKNSSAVHIWKSD